MYVHILHVQSFDGLFSRDSRRCSEAGGIAGCCANVQWCLRRGGCDVDGTQRGSPKERSDSGTWLGYFLFLSLVTAFTSEFGWHF